MKKTMVISLGGSLIIPNSDNFRFLDGFRQTLRKNYPRYKFVVVTGGGTLARKYISVLRKEGKSKYELAQAGIMATRTNAKFIMQIFGRKESNDFLPRSMKEVKNSLMKNNIVICGALRYQKNSTSDTTAAALSNYLNSELINLTNVKGLYDKNPKTNKKAKFISRISWKNFYKTASKISFKAGQHFILDQKAAEIIKKYKIRTYILGQSLKNLDNLLNNRKFIGTVIAN